ncbi:MAG: hypothetical protein HY819_19915 [Acidobacteria bacterium]|nr:hypothetical protein [Acidobacteriota bacterium]
MTSDPKATLEQQYKTLVTRFKQLHCGQDVLTKLGHIATVGTNTIESKIFGALKTLKPLLSSGDALTLNAKLTAIEGYLRDYNGWLEQANTSLTPYGLRQYITQGNLKHDDLIALARFLITRKPDSIDDRGKLELTLSELCRNLDDMDQVKLLKDLFPDFDELTYAATEAINQLHSLIGEIENIKDFPQLIIGEYSNRVRRIKNHFSTTAWNPRLLLVINELNQALEEAFNRLFKAEKKFIINASQRLINSGINSIGKLGESGVLNVEAAARMAEKCDDILTENYQTNLQRLQQLSQVGQWLRHAMEVIENRDQEETPTAIEEQTQPKARPPAERDSKLAPISTVLDYANMSALEQQISDRMEDLAQILVQRPRRASAEVVQLKRTTLLLGGWEVTALASLGNLVASAHKHQYDLIRRAIALIAELQESAVVFTEGMSQKKSSYQYSVPATVYFLEQAQRCQGELETFSQVARQKGDTDSALNLLVTRSKLQEACQKMIGQFKAFGMDIQ